MKLGILVAVLLYLLVLVVGVGTWLARRARGRAAVQGEFALAGRSLSTLEVAATLAFAGMNDDREIRQRDT